MAGLPGGRERNCPRGSEQRGGTGRRGGGRGARGGTAGSAAAAADGDGADHARDVVQGAEVRVGARLLERDRTGGAVRAQLVDLAARGVELAVVVGWRGTRPDRVRRGPDDLEGDRAARRDGDVCWLPLELGGAV